VREAWGEKTLAEVCQIRPPKSEARRSLAETDLVSFVPMEDLGIDQTTFDLSVKNPNGGEEVRHRNPQAIMDEIAALDAESAEVLGNIRGLLK
jgi:hypothetical protein